MKRLLTLIGCSLLSLTSFGQWADFTAGGANWVNLGDLDVAGTQLTVEALITRTAASPGSNIVSKHTNPSDVNYLLRPGGFEITTTNGYFSVGSSVAINLNQTYHVAATYDGSFIRYYVNGCLTGQAACTGNMFQNNLLAAIGNQSNCQCEPFTGYIDEVRIWNVARTQAQIQASMNTVGAGTAGLMAYYNMNGTYINQQGTTTWDGVVVGTVPFSANPYDATPLPAFNSIPTSVNVDCSGFSNGSIALATVGGNPAYQYSLNGGANQAANIFSNLAAGAYTVTVTSADNNCIQQLPLTVTQPAALALSVASQTNVSCNGGTNGSVTVTATGGTNPGTYVWSPNVSATNAASGLAAGQYTVTVIDNVCTSNGVELVNNGNFSSGNTGFSSGYVYTPPPNGGEAEYWVATGSQTSTWNAGMFSNGDHTSGTGNYMLVNGAGTAGANVWCQTVAVTANTDYNFSSWVSSLNNSSPAILQFYINGTPLGTAFNAPATWGTWQQFNASWNSAAATTANICIVNQNTSLGGNDFGLDDISFQQCVKQCSTSTVINITEPLPLTSTLSVSSPTVCPGGSVVLTDSIAGGTVAYTTTWSSGGTSTGTPVTTTVTPLATTTYTASVLDQNSCASTAVATVTIVPQPTVTVNTATICAGQQTATLTASGASTYSWSPAAGLSATSGSTVTATPAATTDYTITGASAAGCTATATSTVTVNALPVVTANTATICAGQQTASLTANGASTYSWSPVTGLSASSGASVTATPTITTDYTVAGTDVNGCINTGTTSVLVNSLPNIIVNSGAICLGSAMTLAANNATTYTWSPGTGLSGTSSGSVTADPVLTTQYTVTGTDMNGCVNTALATVTVNPLPNVSATSVNICAGDAGSLTAGGADFFSWSPTTGLSSSTSANPVASPGTTTVYTVTGTDTNNCQNTATATVTVNPLPLVSINPPMSSGCAPLCVNFSNTGNNSVFSAFSWDFGNGTTSPNPAPQSCYASAGTFTASLTVRDSIGCENSSTAIVDVYPVPAASFSGGPQPTTILEPAIQFYNTSTGAMITGTYWNFGDGDSSSLVSPQHLYTDTGTYYVQLTVISNYGCSASTTQPIYISPEHMIYVPNAFTPNGDNVNDVFLPQGEGITEYALYIFNRWGEEIFSTDDIYQGWDGTKGSVELQQDVYVWKIELRNHKGEPKRLAGIVSLIR